MEDCGRQRPFDRSVGLGVGRMALSLSRERSHAYTLATSSEAAQCACACSVLITPFGNWDTMKCQFVVTSVSLYEYSIMKFII